MLNIFREIASCAGNPKLREYQNISQMIVDDHTCYAIKTHSTVIDYGRKSYT